MDKRTSFTWKFLRESTRAQVDSVVRAILHADNRLTTGRVLRRVLSPTPTHNEHGWACRGLYCADGAGQPSRQSGPEASYDFIPSVNKPPYTTAKTVVGQPVSDNCDGVKVWGSYDVSLLIESPFVPAGYVIVSASGEKGSPLNVVGFREHALPEHRGLRLMATGDDTTQSAQHPPDYQRGTYPSASTR